MKKQLKEELTTAMHGEFKVTATQAYRHKLISVLSFCNLNDPVSLQVACAKYRVTVQEVSAFIPEFIKLQQST